jgi:hypothetical protein
MGDQPNTRPLCTQDDTTHSYEFKLEILKNVEKGEGHVIIGDASFDLLALM